MTPQEERDNRLQQINDLLMPYVKPSRFSWVLSDQYKAVADLARSFYSLEVIDDIWVATYWPGEHVEKCCGAAYNLYVLTKRPVGISFNDIHIVIGAEG